MIMSAIVVAVIVLGGLGVVGALVLYLVSKRFYVKEDPRIELIEQLLPGANCGSCGRSGCHDFACACASASTLDNLVCPGAGDDAMSKIAEIVNLAPVKSSPMVAVLKCNGSCANRPVTSVYDGAESCAILNSLCIGATGCAYGCLGEGDCVDVCRWNAIRMNPVTGLPVIDASLCTGCGACSRACPRGIIELRGKGPRGLRVWVACSSTDRGALAMKACKAACIGCGKCLRECPHGAITLKDNLAYIDWKACKLCRKCELVCPTGAICDAGFPMSARDMKVLADSHRKS